MDARLSSAKVLSFPLAWRYAPKALVAIHREEAQLHSALGAPHLIDEDAGLGLADLWAFEFSCGLQVIVERLHQTDSAFATSDSLEGAHILRHLPFSHDALQLVDDIYLRQELERTSKSLDFVCDIVKELHAYQVWRVDDNGNVFAVGDPISERDAKCWCAQLESHGHKQMYYYRPVGR